MSVCYEGRRIFIKNVNLDKYQMSDLHRDTKRKIKKVGIELPEYFGFMYCGTRSKRKLLLESDNDWVHLSSLWKKAKEWIPIFMLNIKGLTEHHVTEHELEAGQVLQYNALICKSGEDWFEQIDPGDYEALLSASEAKKWASL